MYRYITEGGYRAEIVPISEEQLTLEFEIQEAIHQGRMTVEEGAQCLDDFIQVFDV